MPLNGYTHHHGRHVLNQRYFGGELSQQVFYDQLFLNTLYNLNHLRPNDY